MTSADWSIGGTDMWNGIKFALTLAVLTVALAFSCPAEAQVVGQAIGTDIVAYINNYQIGRAHV